MLFKPKSLDQACLYGQYLENISLNRAQSSGSKKKEKNDVSKEGKKKEKTVKDKIVRATTNHKDPSNHCNIDGHTQEKCWKLDLELVTKNKNKDNKKKSLMATNSSNQVESSSDVEEKIACTSMHKEVNLSSLQQQEEKQMTKLFHTRNTNQEEKD